jgi:uridine kinase
MLAEDLAAAAQTIRKCAGMLAGSRSALVAVSGIDGSGKGYVSARLRDALERHQLRVAVINIDGWLNLPEKRFSPTNPAAHFYANAIRFDEMFDRLVLSLRDRRSIELEADFAEETATRYHRHRYAFADIDVILLEGIYLLKREFRARYDCAIWIDCSFEDALARAIERAQEGLSADATTKAYRTIYFPAQEIHFARDAPRDHALIIRNPATRPDQFEVTHS